MQTRQSAAEHGEIAVIFAQQYGEAGTEIARLLSRLRANRNLADYEDHCEDSEKLTSESLLYARRVLTLLATL